MKLFDDSDFDTIVFDEIFFNNIFFLTKIKKYVTDNLDKIIISINDLDFVLRVPWSIDFRCGSQHYLKC